MKAKKIIIFFLPLILEYQQKTFPKYIKTKMITELPQHAAPNNINQLLQHQLNESKSANKIHSINLSLMDHIFDDIEHQNIVIAKQSKPFKLRKSQQINQANQLQLSHLINKKQTIENQLKKIQFQQYKIHVNQSRLGLTSSKVSQSYLHSNGQRMFKSEMTEEQKQKIKEVIKSQKKFIKSINQKEKQYQQEIQEDRKKNIQIQENLKKEKCEERKKYWEKIKNQIAKRQQQRKFKLVEEQQKLKQIKKSKKLYEVLQDSWNEKISTDENLIKEATKHMKENHKFDLSKINEHQRQCDKIAKQKQEVRLKVKQQFEEKSKLTLPRINSKFLVTLKSEERQKKIEDQEKDNKRFELSQKKHEFAQKVRQDFKPKIDEVSKSTSRMIEEQQKVDKRPGLPFEQVRNLGNDYMRNVHKNIAALQLNKEGNSKITQIQSTNKPVYKNYLNELKEKRSSDDIKFNLTNQVQKIMKNTSYSTIQKVQRAKLVAKRLQSKENNKSSALISSINEKMKILKVISQQ